MLTNCPECNLPISDKAIACPHCGYPLKSFSINRAKRKPKRRRLPNGFGQISELKKQNLRKPFRAMVTIGKTDEGKPICKLLQPTAYFETYNDAYQALMEYNKNPYIYSSKTTVSELYERWIKVTADDHSDILTKQMQVAWKYCIDLVGNMRVLDIRPRHIRQCMEEGKANIKGGEKTATPSVQNLIKILFNKMLDYAVEYEIVDRNYARTFSVPKAIQKSIQENQEHHIPYTDEEMNILWQHTDYPCVDIVLIQCYTGWRPRELEKLKVEDINIEEGTMKGGIKTKAGKDRIVPIHPRIYNFVEAYYNRSVALGSEYLFMVPPLTRGTKEGEYMHLNYNKYWDNLKRITEKFGLNPNHKPHDGRAHFVTQAKKYNVDEYAIKRIVGHTITDVTEGLYTQRSVEWLKQEIEKII